MSFITNIKDYYIEEGFEIYPYTKEEVNKASERLGGFPELFREYLLEIGRIEEEVQMPMRLFTLDEMTVEDGMLIIADFTNAFAIKQSEFHLEQDAPIYGRGEYYEETIEDYDDEWVEWSLDDDGDIMKGLLRFFIVALKDNTDLGIAICRANRKLWAKLNDIK